MDWEKLNALGWKRITCPVCGDMAAAAQSQADAGVSAALTKCERVARESGAYESYRAVGEAFNELRAVLALRPADAEDAGEES